MATKRLIIAHPRSGTKYMSLVCQKWNLDMRHENEGKHGTVTGLFKNISTEPEDFDIILHQIRNPINVIPSMTTARASTFKQLAEKPGEYFWREYDAPHDKAETFFKERKLIDRRLRGAMFTWYFFNRWIETIASWRYQIEDFNSQELCRRLCIEQKPLPRVPPSTNKRKYDKVTWEKLEEVDSEMCKKARELARHYGYNI